MASGFRAVGSVLTERPPADDVRPRPAPYRTASPPPSTVSVPPRTASPLTPIGVSTPPSPEPLIAPGRPSTAQPSNPHTPPPQDATNTGNRAWYDSLLGGREYDVVYDDADGYPLLGFVQGQWYDVTSPDPQPVTVRHAISLDPAWAGAVVQTVCMWMRSNPHHDRAFELATELALTVGELARGAN